MAKAWKTFSLVAVVVLVSSLVAIASPTSAQAGADSTGNMEFTLYAGDYEIVKDDGGLDVIQIEGFSSTASVGNPTLPHNVYNIAVPPDIVWSSLQLEVISAVTITLDGTYDIKPAALPVPQQEGENIVDGKNMDVYGTDADFPENYVSLLPYSQMRKWNFTRVDFTPFQYNPVSGELTLIESVTIEISYEQSGAGLDEALMSDTAMDDIASETFLNYEAAKGWYEPGLTLMSQAIEPQNGLPGYVIITTNAIEAGSSNLASFVTHKTTMGFSVLVVTEDDYGVLTGEAPDTRAEKIRKWLIDNYSSYGIQYVLLIGNPTPGNRTGAVDIPMQMCHPEANHTDVSFEATPTDYYYADLTGDWNVDNDTLFGEWDPDGDGTTYYGDYPVTGGVDFTAEVYVGRIPVYSTDYTALDSILQKVIDYETDIGGTSWRQNILLPVGFQASGYDGSVLAEQMKTNYLNGAGYTSWTMYQQGNGACSLNSTNASDEELRGSPNTPNVFDRWTGAGTPTTPNDFGIVCWWAHGSPTSASVGYSGCWDGILFDSTYCSSLDDSHPAFTYQCSCTNGHPETTNNLQYSILANGGIATVSASRVSWFYSGQTDFTDTPTNSGIGYQYVHRLVNNNPAGQALYDTKAAIDASSLPHWLMNWCDFNLYGDPAVSLAPAEELVYDFGDAPDPTYPTYLANNGARHIPGSMWMGPSLVNNTDLEYDGQPTNLDDVNGVDDEDGVTFYGSSTSPTGPWTMPYVPGQYGRLDIVVNGSGFPGCLHGWIDWNHDGDWDDAGENIFSGHAVPAAATYQFQFNVPADAVGGTTWARFRLDEGMIDGDGEPTPGQVPLCLNSVTGLADNGEVEDYPVSIGEPDIRVDPTEICLSLPPDTTWSGTLRIYNDGDGTLDYTISEQAAPSSASTEVPPGLSVEPASVELPPGFELESSAIEPESPVPSFGWGNIMTEDFEGTWPGPWYFYAGVADVYWGQDSFKPHTGIYSAYCARGGTAGVPAPGPYPNDMYAWMVYGPFSLAEAIDAELNFSFWLDSEVSCDYFYWLASTNGSSFSGWTTSGNWGWTDESFDLSNWCGEPEVYIAFLFISDDSTTTDEGAYVDDVVLRQDIGCPWLDTDPQSGSVLPGEYDEITVTIDTTGMSPGAGGCPSCSGGEPESSAGLIDVLLVAADDSPSVAAVQTYLSAFSDIATVDTFDATTGTPTLSYLQNYDAVLVWSNYAFDNSAALGDVLADYVDSGGGVVVTTFSYHSSVLLAGRLIDEQYSPFVTAGPGLFSWADLGWYDPTHPIMTGVTSISGFYRDDVSLTSGATLVASWDDGQPFVAQKGQVVGVTLWCGWQDDHDWTGDVPTLMHNALFRSAYAWCGDICCDIVINSNDPDEDPVVVPVCLSIEIDYGDAPDPPYPSLAASDGARHIPGNIWLGAGLSTELDSQQVDLDTYDDGVTFLGSSPSSGGPYTLPYVPGQYGAVQIVVSGPAPTLEAGVTIGSMGCLHGWIDWNDDGDWDDTGENVFTSWPVYTPGTYIIEFNVPADAVAGTTWSRFRLDEGGGVFLVDGMEPGGEPACRNYYDGLSYNGEVEDYIIGVELVPPEGWSSDDIGAEVNAYCEFEDVYTTGSGFAHDTEVGIYIFPDRAWSNGMSLSCDNLMAITTTDVDGNLGPELIWAAPVIPGEYDVVFDANRNGVYDALIDYVDHPNHPGFIVNECPEAAFTATPTSGSAPLTVQFTDLSTGDITSWLWQFGDGGFSPERNPSHVYNYLGTYLVTLTVSGPCGEDTTSGYIEVFEEIVPARIIVRNLQIQPAQALPGQQVVVTADVVNQGGTRGSKNIELVINGQAEQSTRVGVDPGAAKHVIFYTSKTVPGTYEVFIEGQASAFNVFLRPRVTSATGVAGGLGTGAIIAIVVIGIIFLVGIIIVFIRVRRPA